MKIIRYVYQEEESYGLICKETVLPLPELAKHFNEEYPENLEKFIVKNGKSFDTIEIILKNIDNNLIRKISKPLSQVSLLPPIAFPPKIICLGLNYYHHAAETKVSISKEPILFLKPHTAITGPNQAIKKPQFVKELDYESELCIVIGKGGKNISIRDAKKHVFLHL